MKIYTKRGDAGDTDLFGGERVKKNHLRVKTYGLIDSANTALGLAYSSADASEKIKEHLVRLMQLLFCAGAEVATAPKERAMALLEKRLANHINDDHVTELERAIDAMESTLTPLRNFILPCGTDTSARLHGARNAVRTAEIALIDLAELSPVRAELIRFFNRLSDYLFVLARVANQDRGVNDITWSGALDDKALKPIVTD